MPECARLVVQVEHREGLQDIEKLPLGMTHFHGKSKPAPHARKATLPDCIGASSTDGRGAIEGSATSYEIRPWF